MEEFVRKMDDMAGEIDDAVKSCRGMADSPLVLPIRERNGLVNWRRFPRPSQFREPRERTVMAEWLRDDRLSAEFLTARAEQYSERNRVSAPGFSYEGGNSSTCENNFSVTHEVNLDEQLKRIPKEMRIPREYSSIRLGYTDAGILASVELSSHVMSDVDSILHVDKLDENQHGYIASEVRHVRDLVTQLSVTRMGESQDVLVRLYESAFPREGNIDQEPAEPFRMITVARVPGTLSPAFVTQNIAAALEKALAVGA